MSTVLRTCLLTGVVDDAALFPPGNAPMSIAVPAHRRHLASPYAELVGRFLCPASRLGELTAELDAEGDPGDVAPIRLGIVADTGADRMPAALAAADHPRLVVEAVEIALPAAPDIAAAVAEVSAALPATLLGYVEIPRAADWSAALDALGAAGRAAKLRTGGATADLFPAVEELTGVLTACAERALPVKCTAGLHHAVRGLDAETGIVQHGFLNVLAAALAVTGGGGDVATILACTDPDELVGWCDVEDESAAAARAIFAGFGSCSIAGPVGDLTDLGLL